jgi:hypothetical protein
MAEPFEQALPPDMILGAGCIVRVTGIDPTTGNTVAGITVNNVVLGVDSATDDLSALQVGPWKLVTGPGG